MLLKNVWIDSPERILFRIALVVPIVLTLTGLVLMFYKYDDLQHSAEKLRYASSDNVTWTIVQVEVDYQNLQLALLNSLLTTGLRQPKDLANVKRTFDVFFSRVETVRSVHGGAFSTGRDGPGLVLSRISRANHQVAREIDILVSPSSDELSEIFTTIKSINEDVRLFTTQALQVLVTDAAARREEHLGVLDHYTSLLLVVVGLLLGLLSVSLVLLRKLKTRAAEIKCIAENLQRVIETSHDAIIISDAHGKIIEYSSSAESIFGYTSEEALGAEMSALLIPDRFREAHRQGMKRFLGSGIAKMVGAGRQVTFACDKEGREFPVELSITASRDTYDKQIFLGVVRDISDIVESKEKLKSALEVARREVSAKERFLAVMSHEMRTPLQGVLAAFDLVDAGAMCKKQVEFIDLGKRSGMKALKQINSVLELARLNDNRPVDMTDVINPTSFLQHLVDSLEPLTLQNGNSVKFASCCTEIFDVLANRRLFNAIFENILANANKFTTKGHIEINIEMYRTSTGMVDLMISICDDGIGIAETALERIFEPFSTGNSGDTEGDSTGLGLAIVMSATQKMGGKVSVQSSPGLGSKFTFNFCFEVVAAVNSIETNYAIFEETCDIESHTEFQGSRILIVDDNEINRTLIGAMVERMNCNYDYAKNGFEAVEKCRYSIYDLILMDLNMPHMSGLDATTAIRSLDRKQGPIICITAQYDEEISAAILEAGMVGIVFKPIRIETLSELLENWLPIEQLSLERQSLSDSSEVNDSNIDAAVVEDLIATMGSSYVEEILEKFIVSSKLAIVNASEYLKSEKNTEAAAELHGLAGSAGMVGALEVYQASLYLATQALGGTLRADNGALSNLHQQLASFIRSISSKL